MSTFDKPVHAIVGGTDTSSIKFAIEPTIIEHTDKIPADVREAMIAMLHEAHKLARADFSPSDGSLRHLDDRLPDRDIHGGEFEPNGWTLQACSLTDSRFEIKGPQVVVHAYQGDSLTKGSVARAIEYTPEDERALKVKRLEALRVSRARLDAEIAKLKLEVSPDYAEGYEKAREDIMSIAGQGSAFARMREAEKKVVEDTALLEYLRDTNPACPSCFAPNDGKGHADDCPLAKRLSK